MQTARYPMLAIPQQIPQRIVLYIPLTTHISRPRYDTDDYHSHPPFPLYYLIPCAFLYIPKRVSLYPNRLGSSSCLSLNCERVLRLPLNGQCASTLPGQPILLSLQASRCIKFYICAHHRSQLCLLRSIIHAFSTLAPVWGVYPTGGT